MTVLSSVQRDLASRDVWSIRSSARTSAGAAPAPPAGLAAATCCLRCRATWPTTSCGSARAGSANAAARRRTTAASCRSPPRAACRWPRCSRCRALPWRAMAGRLATAPTSEAKPPRRDRGAAAWRSLQRALGISADGVFGPQTERALKRWQRSHGLVADGIAGPATRRALGIGAGPVLKRSGRRARARSRAGKSRRSRGGGVSALQRSARRARRRRVRLPDRAGAQALAAPARADAPTAWRAPPRAAPSAWAPARCCERGGRAGGSRRQRLGHRAASRRRREPDRLQALQVRRRARLVPRLGLRLLRLGVLRAPRRRPAGPPARLGRVHQLRAPRTRQAHHDLRELRPRLHGRQRPPLRHQRPPHQRIALDSRQRARRATWPATPRASSSPKRSSGRARLRRPLRSQPQRPAAPGQPAHRPAGLAVRPLAGRALPAANRGPRSSALPTRARARADRRPARDRHRLGRRARTPVRAAPSATGRRSTQLREDGASIRAGAREPRSARPSEAPHGPAARGRLPGHLPRASPAHSARSASAWPRGRPR